MSEHSEAEEHEQNGTGYASPGRLLREAREGRAWSVREVANSLHLTMHYVNALESDEFDKLPGDVFVRGYIRSYAQLLEEDPDRILTYYRECTQRRQAREDEAFKRYTRQRNDRNRPWIIVSGVALAGLAVCLWYLTNGQDQPADTDLSSNGSTVSPPRDDGLQLSPVQEDNGAAASGFPDAPPDREPPGGELVATERLTLDWGGPDVLQLLLATDSQVRVGSDGSQAQGNESIQKGGLLRVQGRAPFDVVIDSAYGAVVTFNGREVEVSRHIRDDGSARLTIGIQ